ncbi:uncharacterized protein LOC126893908 [Daktulosphaira vitifoliae]|uniref:uncharacterized protein LOC126893908 n=1 Tax=Daktulosphaira vitifoliae TaxID=58002 RepID=UPI0021A9DA59|nr:uncharacterized protein LOC126893908 [Daktulosphaira vitifoliae]
MKFYCLICVAIFIMQQDISEQYSKYRESYKNYIKTVICHIHSKIQLNEMLNLKSNNNTNNTVVLIEFQSGTNMHDFSENYSNTISILNFKYTEILKTFLNYLDFILRKCKQFHDENLWENFICCITSLVEEVKNSNTMLDYLYNAMKYISDIDVRYVFKGHNVPNAIVDEIDFFKQLVLQYTSETVSFDLNSLPHLKDSETKFKNLNEFYAVASETVNIMFQNNNLIDTFIETNSITNQITECSNKNDSYLVYLTCSNLNAFYNETIDMWYKNLGFDLFFNPIIPKFTPPLDPKINQNDGIKVLNILRQESGWKTMNHIKIIYNGKSFSVDFIMKDEINNINFRVKKEHIIQLLRCRYTEIIKNYDIIVSAILHICQINAHRHYHNCLVELFDSLNKSKTMFNGLKSAITTLNESSIWSFNVNSQSNLQKIFDWAKDFLNLLNNNEFSKDKNEYNEIPITENVEKILKNFLIFRDIFYRELRNDTSHMSERCVLENSYLEKFKLINDFRFSKITNQNFVSTKQIYQNGCNFFDSFCKSVYENCYENLGFNSITFTTSTIA